MWLFTPHGFYSAVSALDGGKVDPTRVCVRARVRRHLLALCRAYPTAFGPKDVARSDTSDYRYRVVLPRRVWVDIVTDLAADVDYPNFKSAAKAAHPADHGYHDALLRVWCVMAGLQRGEGRQALDALRPGGKHEPPPLS